MITIKQLTYTSFETIHKAFTNAFSDYVEPFDLSLEQLKYMVERRGCDLNLSFGAFNNDQLVSFTLNGIGDWKDQLTAYDTGTGTIKEFRKQGIAKRIFNESLPVLREHNIKQYLLEVIKSNTGAYELYKKAGFEIIRELDYFVSTKNEIRINEKKLSNGFQTKEIVKPDWETLKAFWDFEPSWQNSIDSIERKMIHFKVLGVFDNEKIIGYGIIEKHTGDIPQLAVAKEYRRRGVATAIINQLINYSDSESVRFINSCSGSESFRGFAKSINMPAGKGQYEMLLKLESHSSRYKQ